MTVYENLRRAMLFMPGDDERKIRKGAALDVDAVILDLEDSVAYSQKVKARQIVRQTLTDREIDFGATEKWVRVNNTSQDHDLNMLQEDIRSTAIGRPVGYVIPKAQSPHRVFQIERYLRKVEKQLAVEVRTLKLIIIIESALGVVNLKDLLNATEGRIVAIAFGAADFTSSIGAIRTREGVESLYARSKVVTHAAAYGLQAIDTPYFDLDDEEGLIEDVRFGRQLGFTGKLAIHPKQLGPIVTTLLPTMDEIANARRLIEAHTAHQRNGIGVFAYEGQMVDMPMIRAAQRVLQLAGDD